MDGTSFLYDLFLFDQEMNIFVLFRTLSVQEIRGVVDFVQVGRVVGLVQVHKVVGLVQGEHIFYFEMEVVHLVWDTVEPSGQDGLFGRQARNERV